MSMRMRKKRNFEARMEACGDLLLVQGANGILNMKEAAENYRACIDFQKAFGNDHPVTLEIGCGKGGFACGMAAANPEVAYFAMERVTDCVVLAAEKAKESSEARGDNLRFITDTADNLLNIFAPRSVDAIFLNFSDPWPKKGYAKRRLTHRRYLALYAHLLKDGGIIRFKTDNDGLFDFSLEEFAAMELPLDKMTRDLHSSEWNEGNIMTEYETAFSSQGVLINMLETHKPAGYSRPLDPSFIDKDFYKRKD